MELATLKQSDQQAVETESKQEQATTQELYAIELAYVGGGMGIHCWG